MMQNPHYDSSNKGPKGVPGPAGKITSPTADVSFGNHKITNLGNPRDGTDAVNKNYADSRYIQIGQNLNMRGMRITNMDAPINSADAATKAYVEDGFHKKNVPINMNGQKITNMGTPTSTTDAANRAYVDAATLNFSNITINRTLTTTNTSFPHNFPAGYIYFIWFRLTCGDNLRWVVMHPYGLGRKNDVAAQVNDAHTLIYSYDDTHLYCRRSGSGPTMTLYEIGILYYPI